MSPTSLAVLCLLLFADGATFSVATTPLLLGYGRYHPAWQVALAGGSASAAGSVLQFALLRWILHGGRPWMRRFAPSRARLEQAIARYPSASFATIAVARATPLPDAPVKLVAAASGYPLALYFVAVLLGALPYYFVVALVGRAVRLPVWVLVAVFGAIVIAAVADRLRRMRARA